jgi:hypothetical protein
MKSPFGSIPSTVTTAWPSRRSTLTVVSLRVLARSVHRTTWAQNLLYDPPPQPEDTPLALASAVNATDRPSP